MPLDLAEYELKGVQRLRIALLQELLDRTLDPKTALDVARDAEAWIVGKVDEAAEVFQPHLLREAMRPLVIELLSPQTLIDLVTPLVNEMLARGTKDVTTRVVADVAEEVKRLVAEQMLTAQPTPLLEKPEIHGDLQVDAARRDDESIKEMHAKGWTSDMIGDALNLSSGYVRSRIVDLGLPPRKPGPAKGIVFRAPTAEPAPKKDLSPSEARQAQALIAAFGYGASFNGSDVAKALGTDKNVAAARMSVLVAKGAAVRISIGIFQMVPSAIATDSPPQQHAAPEVTRAPAPTVAPAPAPPFNARSNEARSQVDEFIAKHGVSTGPTFGFPEIDKLYPEIRLRGHSLARTANKKAFLGDGYKTMTYSECFVWMKNIINQEPVLPEKEGKH